MKAKISVVMSVYNEKIEDIKKSIESVQNQTFKELELVVVLDNPQNEKAIELLNEYALKDERIKVITNEENLGVAKSNNIGVENAVGEYVARLDSDDISEPNRLEKEYNFLETNKDIDIVATNTVYINENDEVFYIPSHLPSDDKSLKRILKYTDVLVHSTLMYRKDKIVKMGKYRMFPAALDYDFILRACSSNLKFAVIDEPLVKYRVRQNNISNSKALKQFLLGEYSKKLYRQRMKTGTDEFSEENLQKYLEDNNAFDEKENEKYKIGMQNLNELKMSVKNKKILSSLKYFFKALFSQKKMKAVLFNYIVGFCLK